MLVEQPVAKIMDKVTLFASRAIGANSPKLASLPREGLLSVVSFIMHKTPSIAFRTYTIALFFSLVGSTRAHSEQIPPQGIGARQALSSCERDYPGISAVLDYIRASFPKTVREHKDDDGDIIGVPFPYNVPCMQDDFQELYYWDTYFINLGLNRLGMEAQAKNNVDDLLTLVEKLSFVPNANRRESANRTQGPYLAIMVRDILGPKTDHEWLARTYSLLAEEYSFWAIQRSTDTGLCRFHHSADVNYLRQFYGYLASGRFKQLSLTRDEEKIRFSSNALSEAESGWDFTPRFSREAENWCAVDLNSNLYLYEVILADLSRTLGNGREESWLEKAAIRKARIQQYLWNDELGCYTDYDFVGKKRGTFVSCATLYPLFAGVATADQARKVVNKMRAVLEYEHGLVPCEKQTHSFTYQWDYPNVWAPLQCISVQALDKYGYKADAQRIAEKYVRTVIRNFQATGNLWEKYNAVTGGTDVKSEFGYPLPKMVGWSAGVFVFCAEYLQRTVHESGGGGDIDSH